METVYHEALFTGKYLAIPKCPFLRFAVFPEAFKLKLSCFIQISCYLGWAALDLWILVMVSYQLFFISPRLPSKSKCSN